MPNPITTATPATAGAPAATRRALVAGASGLVGRALLDHLLAADSGYEAVHTLGRRALPLSHPALTQHTVDFAALPELPAVDDAYIALGTTIKVAGSQQAFRAVDFDAVVAAAHAARAAGATRLAVVSAMGADSRSSIFYNRVKGDMEAAVGGLGFDTLMFARPSFLAGDRAALNQPLRGGEKLALSVSRWLAPVIPRHIRSIAAGDVAAAMILGLRTLPPGRHVVLSGDLSRMARTA